MRTSTLARNGIQFAEHPRNRNAAYFRPMRFDLICEANGIEHHLAKPKHPWTNGQVERMLRTIKDATVKRYHYDSQSSLEGTSQTFWTPLEDIQRAYSLQIHLQNLDFRARSTHRKSDPPNAGTEHLTSDVNTSKSSSSMTPRIIKRE